MTALAVLALVLGPGAAWGQWTGTNPLSTNSKVGINVLNGFSPQTKLDVGTTALSSVTPIWGVTTSGAIAIDYSRAGGPGYVPGIVWYAPDHVNGLPKAGMWMIDSDGGSFLQFGTSNNYWAGINNSAITVNPAGNVGIGTINPLYKLAVYGTIGAQDVTVTNSGWSDYVFRPGYRLRSLSEVSQYIQTNGHLPDIPTEAEVKEKGVSLGDMQAKLLAKVEELTLHMIQADQRNDRLERENQELRERMGRLEKFGTVVSTPIAAQ
jgi:hypothetical protein